MRTLGSTLVVGLLVLGVAACSDEQKRDIEGAGIKVTMQDKVEDVLSADDVELEDDLSCEANIADDGGVTGSCGATDVDGNAIAAQLTGEADVDEVSCVGTLTVDRGDENLYSADDFDCLDS